jgi:dTDP-4-dehydrorhamnose 3,5-epimerase-like enzyme
VIDGLVRIPLRRFEDERGWFTELRRESLLPKATVQTNVSFSRAGTIRGLHYHERGQDVAVYIPGRHAHGFEALTDLLFVYHVTEEYDPADPDEHAVPWDDPRVRELWSTTSPILSERDKTAAS